MNDRDYLSAKGVNGLLVGHNSLIAPEFAHFVDTAAEVAKQENVANG